ncbi:MAG: SAM-dependent methyltransferase, partial [Acidobacteria bacterium]|nr:SAM-dependent methyltransferase [Acidobacteriota bacterium]
MQILKWVLLALALSGLYPPRLRAQESRHPVTGRVYAGVMGIGGAHWLERSERESEEHTRLAVRLLDLRPG